MAQVLLERLPAPIAMVRAACAFAEWPNAVEPWLVAWEPLPTLTESPPDALAKDPNAELLSPLAIE